jgi:hypothetical protein
MSEALKWCAACEPSGAWQPAVAFGRDRSKADGRQSRCRACCKRRREQRPVERPLARGALARWVWTLECVLCGGHEETARFPLLRPVYCWRDRSRLLLSAERLTGDAARPGRQWGIGPALASAANREGW